MENKIVVKFIVELMGSPKEHVDKTMRMVMEKIKKDDRFRVKNMKMFELQKIKELWSTFIEADIEFKASKDIIDFCFNYMPSSVEILAPEKVKDFRLKEMAELFNEMLGKLHKYDLILKNLHAENVLMKRKLESS